MYELQNLYFIFVIISFFYIFFKFGTNKISILVVFVFWEGLFSYFGTSIHNYYKIFIVLYALVFFSGKIKKKYLHTEKYVNLFFILFSFSFFFSYMLNGGKIFTILSQYLYKYGFVFLIYHGIKDITYDQNKIEFLKNLILQILYIQVLLSILKILLYGFGVERTVGSINYSSGGMAVILPILGLIFYWIITSGIFKAKDWLLVCSLLIIAIASEKRSPIILFPLFILLLFFYVRKNFRLIRIVKYFPLVFLIFYVGLRITPSFNPEHKIGGSFDIKHAVNFIIKYNFGTTNKDLIYSENYENSGRGGSLLLPLYPEKLALHDLEEKLLGKGIYEVATLKYGRFLGGNRYGIEHAGLVGAINKELYSIGYLNVIFLILFSLMIIKTIKYKRFRITILVLYFWSLFLYGNQLFISNASTIIIIYICFYSYFIYNSNITKHKLN